jgi:hypothetical protein
MPFDTVLDRLTDALEAVAKWESVCEVVGWFLIGVNFETCGEEGNRIGQPVPTKKLTSEVVVITYRNGVF